eukprot:451172-Prymnesium_polylepis.1
MANRSSEWRANCWGRHEEALCEREGRSTRPCTPRASGVYSLLPDRPRVWPPCCTRTRDSCPSAPQ